MAMRAPTKGDDYFCNRVNGAAENVQKTFLDAIKPAIKMHKHQVMLGDGTVAEADTFDPDKVQDFFRQLEKVFENWTCSGIHQSVTDDLHRIYSTFSKEIGKFYITIYFGIQFHVLLYYRVDREVIEIQKELAQTEDKAASTLDNLKSTANEMLVTELGKRGYMNLNFDELFVKVFEDDDFLGELSEKAAVLEDQFPGFREAQSKKSELLSSLQHLIMKFYVTSPVLIDYNRLMQGEEGVTNYFDIEIVKRNKKSKIREAFVDTAKISEEASDALSKELDMAARTLRKIAC